ALLAKQWLTGTDMARSRLRNREFGGSNPYHAVCQSLTHNQHKTTAAVPTRINSVNHTATPCGATGLGHSGSVSVHADLDECLDVGQRGGFYESMMTADELAQGGKYRDRLKRRFCGVLFGENQGRGRFPNEMRRRFRQRYPAVAAMLRELKRRNYRHSAHVLQNYEATLF